MNFLATSTIGIDTVIKEIQTDLYDALLDRWQGSLDGYGRVYKTDTGTGVVPRYYISDNDYKDVYYDDSMSGVFFFLTEESSSTDDELLFENDTKVVFMVDLNQIIGEGRQDELARRDAVEILREISFQKFTITGIDTGVTNVFNGLDFSKIRKADINPLHTFCVNIRLQYYLTDKCD